MAVVEQVGEANLPRKRRRWATTTMMKTTIIMMADLFVEADKLYKRDRYEGGSALQSYRLGYVITQTCTADFDMEECFGAPGSRWWE